MSKTLLWIDDSMEYILEVIQGAIVDSWKLDKEDEEGMKTRIVIFGDACHEEDSTALWEKRDEMDMNGKLLNTFLEECENMEGPTDGNRTAEMNLNLIDNAIQILFKAEDSEEDRNLYYSVKKIWKKESDEEDTIKDANSKKKESETNDSQQIKNDVTKIIERMHIENNTADKSGSKEETVIGIDLALLSGDLERVRKNKKIISMEFYHQLKGKKYPCFIYSSNADDYQLIEAWKDTYQKLYNDNSPVPTYERSDFSRKSRENMIERIERDVIKHN